MPFTHEISPERKLARVTSRNPVTLEEIQESIRTLHGEAGFEPDFRILVDLLEMDVRLSNDEVLAMAETLGENRDRYRSRIALVVADDLRYGLMRMATSYADSKGLKMSVFRDLESARKWLGVESPA